MRQAAAGCRGVLEMQSLSEAAAPGTHAPLCGCAQPVICVLPTIDCKGLACEAVQPATQAPVFNFPGEKQRRFCYDHKLPGMVNLRRADKRPCSANLNLNLNSAAAPAATPAPPLPVSCPSD